MHKISKSCRMCGSRKLVTSGQTEDYQGTNITFFLCETCHAYVPDYFSNWENTNIISQQLKLHEDLWSEDNQWAAEKEALEPLANYLIKLIEASDKKNVLEIGAGRCLLTAAIKDKNINITAVEPSQKLTSKAKELFNLEDSILDIEAADFFRLSTSKYNLIILWHVIEHMESPIAILKECVPSLTPGGIIAIQTPLPRKDYIFPEHLFFPTPGTYNFVASELNLHLRSLEVDPNNAFLTCIFAKNAQRNDSLALSEISLILNTYQSALDHAKDLAISRLAAMDEMGQLISKLQAENDALKSKLENRNGTKHV